MCDTCGCGQTAGFSVDGAMHHHHHDHEHGHDHEHHGHAHATSDTDHESGGDSRIISMEQDVLGKNDAFARANRRRLDEAGTVAINLISSPGAGKTSLLEASLKALKEICPLAVVEGDLQTDNDARRIQGVGVNVHQINTVGGCHLDAHMVGHAFDHLGLDPGGVLFIENVGNLVCPASFDLGEHARVVLLSVTEGDDKPAKYPVAFMGSALLLITKIDLLPYVDFSVDRCRQYAKTINPDIEIIECSARTGEGMGRWIDWVKSRVIVQS